LDLVELDDNEAAFRYNFGFFFSLLFLLAIQTLLILILKQSVCTCTFRDHDEVFVIVGTAKDLKLHPRSCSGGFLHVYRIINDGTKLELVHKVTLD
jgi:hypothetical protein